MNGKQSPIGPLLLHMGLDHFFPLYSSLATFLKDSESICSYRCDVLTHNCRSSTPPPARIVKLSFAHVL